MTVPSSGAAKLVAPMPTSRARGGVGPQHRLIGDAGVGSAAEHQRSGDAGEDGTSAETPDSERQEHQRFGHDERGDGVVPDLHDGHRADLQHHARVPALTPRRKRAATKHGEGNAPESSNSGERNAPKIPKNEEFKTPPSGKSKTARRRTIGSSPRLFGYQREEEDFGIAWLFRNDTEIDNERELHRSYSRKLINCPSGKTLCLACHLCGTEKLLKYDNNEWEAILDALQKPEAEYNSFIVYNLRNVPFWSILLIIPSRDIRFPPNLQHITPWCLNNANNEKKYQ
uniref:Uncharacterized protein n=1 Tax=Oryza punctata TaxID=4537 RepID=A0A0E0MGY0_ORYPU